MIKYSFVSGVNYENQVVIHSKQFGFIIKRLEGVQILNIHPIDVLPRSFVQLDQIISVSPHIHETWGKH